MTQAVQSQDTSAHQNQVPLEWLTDSHRMSFVEIESVYPVDF